MGVVCEDVSDVNIGGTKELLELGGGQVRTVNCFFFVEVETGELDRGRAKEQREWEEGGRGERGEKIEIFSA